VGGGEPAPPPYPDRLRDVEFAFGRYAHVTEIRMHGGKVETAAERKKR
jgi:hypothetical protein